MSSLIAQIRAIQEVNEKEVKEGIVGTSATWHAEFLESAYVHFGNVASELSEGDILMVFSEYGDVVDIDLKRDEFTGKSQGWGFLCYEDQRSTVLAVDNLNGVKLLGREMKVNHTKQYFKKLKDGETLRIPFLVDEIFGKNMFNMDGSLMRKNEEEKELFFEKEEAFYKKSTKKS